MLPSFEIKLSKGIELSIGNDKKIVEKIEIRKPVFKYRFLYINFYQELTKSLLSIKPTKKDIENEEKKKDDNDENKFDQETAIAVGSLHMSEDLIQKLFKFLEIGDN